MKRVGQSFLALTVMMAGACLCCLGNDVVSEREAVSDYYNRMYENTQRATKTPVKAEGELKQWREQRQEEVNESINQPPAGFAHYDHPTATPSRAAGNNFDTANGSRKLAETSAAPSPGTASESMVNVIRENVLAVFILGFFLIAIGYVWCHLKKAEMSGTPPPELPGNFSA